LICESILINPSRLSTIFVTVSSETEERFLFERGRSEAVRRERARLGREAFYDEGPLRP
jgi:hypothetical protein